jgi:hypothetical protein
MAVGSVSGTTYTYLCDRHARELNMHTLQNARTIANQRSDAVSTGVVRMSYEYLHMVALAVSGTRCSREEPVSAYRRVNTWCSSTVFAYEKILRHVEVAASSVTVTA